jgi:hypothetical protein
MVTVLQWPLFSAHYRPLTCKHAHFAAVVFFWCQCRWMGSVFFVTAPLWILTGNCTPSLPYCHIGYHPSSFTVLPPHTCMSVKGERVSLAVVPCVAETCLEMQRRLMWVSADFCWPAGHGVCWVREWVSEWMGLYDWPSEFSKDGQGGRSGF